MIDRIKDFFAAKVGNVVTSVIRTVVPIIVGALISWAVRHGIHLDEAEVTAWLTPVLQGAYYTVARNLEKRWPEFGWLLGLPKQPGYRPADAPPPQPPPPGSDKQ